MRRLIHLTNRHRTPGTNLTLGLVLAFTAGAINAGGFLVLHMYTSHMTGFASQLADALVLDNHRLLLNALGAILAFMCGAATCAVLVNWSRQRHLHSVYALPLMLEALLLFPFGLMGAVTLRWDTPFAVPLTVLLPMPSRPSPSGISLSAVVFSVSGFLSLSVSSWIFAVRLSCSF